MDKQILEYIIFVAFFSFIMYRIYKKQNMKCTVCGGRLKNVLSKDHMGFQITKNISISFYKGPRKYTEVWKCSSCGRETVEKFWGS